VAGCAECGYQDDSLGAGEIVPAIPALAAQHQELLSTAPADQLRARTRPGWSALEYGGHVRDVLRFQRARVILAQSGRVPEFTSMNRDERAVTERYNEQDPATVAGELSLAAGLLSATLARLPEHGWQRTGIYPWPEAAERDVLWIGRRSCHELAHHLFDERRLLAGPPA
jgi:hypothetical protein